MSILDNTLISNNPLTPYLHQDDGAICFVDSYDEAVNKPVDAKNRDKPHVYFKRGSEILFIKKYNDKGGVEMATFETNQIPNPVPVTQTELSKRISEIENGINTRFKSIEERMDKILSFFSDNGKVKNEPDELSKQ